MSVASDSGTTEGLSLERAQELFKEQGAVGNRTSQSVGVYMNGVNALRRWASENGYTTMADLNKLNVGGFNPWLTEVEDWSNPYKQSITTGARQFLKFLEERDIVDSDTHKLIKYHHVPKSERQSDNEIEIERLDRIIAYLEKHHPHSRDTIILKILSNTAMRCCGLHSLDVGDVRLDDEGRPEIAVRNRPREGTKLKKGDDHERNIPITFELYEEIGEYVENHRHGVTDDYGRLSLITSRYGRLSKSAIQDVCYKWTCPPHTGELCTCCEGKPTVKEASKCRESHGPHAIRGAACTRWFNAGKSADDVSIVAAADAEILARHYDRGDMADKADRARSLLDVLE